MDCFPILRKIPTPLNSEYRHARKIYYEESDLYTSHWMDAKQRILRGTYLVCCLICEAFDPFALTGATFQAMFQRRCPPVSG